MVSVPFPVPVLGNPFRSISVVVLPVNPRFQVSLQEEGVKLLRVSCKILKTVSVHLTYMTLLLVHVRLRDRV